MLYSNSVYISQILPDILGSPAIGFPTLLSKVLSGALFFNSEFMM